MLRLAAALSVLSIGCTNIITGDSAADAGAASEGRADAATAEPEPSAEVTGQGRVTGTGGVGLNLREEPSTEAAVIRVLDEGTIVDLVGEAESGWYLGRHEGDEGYLSADFITEIEPGAQDGGYLNLLPWQAEQTFKVTQAHGTFSHVGDSYWAWDFGMPVGTPVLAAHNGVVRLSRGDGGGGCCDPSCGSQANYVIIERGDGYESAYVHLSEALVAPGDIVVRGDLIGRSGESGYVCGAHLHFQMQKTPANPTTSYSPSVQDVFHDIGEPFDPEAGTQPVSKNGVLDIP